MMAEDEPLLPVGEVLNLSKADWVYGDRGLTVRVSDIRYGLDKSDCLVVAILATVMEFGRDGRTLTLNVYKSALTRPGVRAVNGAVP
jgi:hypothetical protein